MEQLYMWISESFPLWFARPSLSPGVPADTPGTSGIASSITHQCSYPTQAENTLIAFVWLYFPAANNCWQSLRYDVFFLKCAPKQT